ncbi:ATP-binding protein [Catenulispora yoronensis]
MPPQEQAKVFEEFHQVRGAHQRGKAGTGLGLPYARSLVTLLGGTITLTSAVGEGTTVIAALPRTVELDLDLDVEPEVEPDLEPDLEPEPDRGAPA